MENVNDRKKRELSTNGLLGRRKMLGSQCEEEEWRRMLMKNRKRGKMRITVEPMDAECKSSD